MPWSSFKLMTDDKLKAIYKYLQTVPAEVMPKVEKWWDWVVRSDEGVLKVPAGDNSKQGYRAFSSGLHPVYKNFLFQDLFMLQK